MPINGVDEKGGDESGADIRTTFSKPQLDFLDKIVESGLALRRSDAVRYVVVRAMEQAMEGT